MFHYRQRRNQTNPVCLGVRVRVLFLRSERFIGQQFETVETISRRKVLLSSGLEAKLSACFSVLLLFIPMEGNRVYDQIPLQNPPGLWLTVCETLSEVWGERLLAPVLELCLEEERRGRRRRKSSLCTGKGRAPLHPTNDCYTFSATSS